MATALSAESSKQIWWWIAWLHHNNCFFLCNSGPTCIQGMRNSTTVKMLEVETFIFPLLLKDTLWKGWVLFEDVENFRVRRIITSVEGRAKFTQIAIIQFSKCWKARMDFALIILATSPPLLLVEKAMSTTENVCSCRTFLCSLT